MNGCDDLKDRLEDIQRAFGGGPNASDPRYWYIRCLKAGVVPNPHGREATRVELSAADRDDYLAMRYNNALAQCGGSGGA